MSRQRSDYIVGIIGAAAIVLTLVGVFIYEYNNAPDGDVDGGVDGGTNTTLLPSEDFSGALAQGGSASEMLSPSAGIQNISIEITWTPSAPGQAQALASYTYQLLDPNGDEVDSGTTFQGTTLSVNGAMDGQYTLNLSASSQSAGGNYAVAATYTY